MKKSKNEKFHLSFELLNVSLVLLLPLPGVLDLVQLPLQPGLELVEVGAAVVEGLDALLLLQLGVVDGALLAVQPGNCAIIRHVQDFSIGYVIWIFNLASVALARYSC